MKKYLFKFKGLFLVNVIFILAASVFNVSLAFLLKYVIDIATTGNMDKFKSGIVIAIIFVISAIVVSLAQRILMAKYIKKIIFSLKNDIFNKIIGRNIKSFGEENSAKYMSILSNDINIIEQDYFINILEMINQIIAFIIATIAIIKLNIYITIGVFVFAGIAVSIPILFGKQIGVRKKVYSDSLEVFTTKMKDMFSGFEVIKSFNIEEKINEEYADSNQEVENSKYRFSRLSAFVEILSQMIAFSMFLVALIIGAYFVIKGTMTIGGLIAAVQLMNSIANPIVNISTRVNKLKSVKLIEEKIMNISNEEEAEDVGLEKVDFENNISFEDVGFSYNDDRVVLDRVNLNLEKGKKYVIVGGSGSGKSTILKLLLRYYDDFRGNIKIDQVDNRKIKISSLYNMISVIQQNVFMFDKKIRDNITLFNEYSEEEVQKAIMDSGLGDLVKSLPQGLDNLVGENGGNLSGGEKQRVAIARALIKNTPILVLDEATSALDNETAYNIEKSMLDLQGTTCIVVTHKLMESLLREYDAIITVKNGKIEEMGSFSELMSKRGYFYSLYNVAN